MMFTTSRSFQISMLNGLGYISVVTSTTNENSISYKLRRLMSTTPRTYKISILHVTNQPALNLHLSQEHPVLYTYASLYPELRISIEVNVTLAWHCILHLLTEFVGYLA